MRHLHFHFRFIKRYPSLIFRLLPTVAGIPVAVVLVSDFNGPNIEQALTTILHFMFSPSGFFSLWLVILFTSFLLYRFLHPISKFYCLCADTEKHSCTIQDAETVISRFNALHKWIIGLSIVGFALGELVTKHFADTESLFTLSRQFYFLDSLSKGLLTGVLMSFSADNILFEAKRAALAMNPVTKLKRTSLYNRIFLALAAVFLFLSMQIFKSSSRFFEIGAQIPGFSSALGGISDDMPEFFRQARDNEIVNHALKVDFIKILLYLSFVLQLLYQIKNMFRRPIDTMRSRLQTLNSGNIQTIRAIDIYSNDEFAVLFREINTLIARQQEELACSSNRLDNIVEMAADPIISFFENGMLDTFNPAASAFFGYTREEASTLHISRLLSLTEEEKKACGDCTETEMVIKYLFEKKDGPKRFTGIHKSGKLLRFESNLSMANTQGEVLFTAIIRDITAQMEWEANITKAKIAAETANRMKSEFLANMSHELRTPLNAVLGFTQLMSSDKNLTSGQAQKIEIIARSGEHLLSLINDILDISKIEAGKIEVHEQIFNPGRFIEDIQEMFSLKCKKANLNLFVEFTGDIPGRVRGDLGKLRQIMINLVGNAVKFTKEGGIGIIVGPDVKNGNLRFSVTDTGKGIPKDELDLIVQPFTQSSVTQNEGGTGLGLAISSRYIRMMGGELEIKSELGKGSSFSFSVPLPSTTEELPEETLVAVAAAVKKGTSVTALIVDDKEMNRLVLKEMLEGAGFNTIEADNGQAALEMASTYSPALIFMDIKMPVMDGYDAMRALKAKPETASIPVFALTASAFISDEQHMLEEGFDGFLAKPFKQSSLFALIKAQTSIELEYESGERRDARGLPDESRLDYKAAASRLGEAFITKLKDYIQINDFTAIAQLAISIQDTEQDLSRLMKYHADSFDEQGLQRIVAALGDKQHL